MVCYILFVKLKMCIYYIKLGSKLIYGMFYRFVEKINEFLQMSRLENVKRIEWSQLMMITLFERTNGIFVGSSYWWRILVGEREKWEGLMIWSIERHIIVTALSHLHIRYISSWDTRVGPHQHSWSVSAVELDQNNVEETRFYRFG